MDHSITPSTTAARFTAATLTPVQLDGLTCITCGSDDQPMKPVEVRDGVQVFECTTHDAPLTADQLAGRACVACGAQGKPMHVAGEVPGHGDVFECASHITATTRNLAAVQNAVALNPTPTLTDREVGLIFRIGSMSSVVIADELDIDVRDFGITDVQDMLSAQELNALVFFVRDLLGRRQAGAA